MDTQIARAIADPTVFERLARFLYFAHMRGFAADYDAWSQQHTNWSHDLPYAPGEKPSLEWLRQRQPTLVEEAQRFLDAPDVSGWDWDAS